MSDLDALIRGLRINAADIEANIASRQDEISEMRERLARIEGQIEGLLKARDLFGAPPLETEQRRSVKRPVIARLAQYGKLTETEIIDGTGLPESVVHKYLLRAVAAGEVAKDGDAYKVA